MRVIIGLFTIAVVVTTAACAPVRAPVDLSQDHPANPQAETEPIDDVTPDLEERDAPLPVAKSTPSAHGDVAAPAEHKH